MFKKIFIIKKRLLLASLIILNLVIALSPYAQANTASKIATSEQAKKLNAAFKKLQKDGHQSQGLIEYIKHFPRTKESFNHLFGNSTQSPLYDGSLYMLQLEYFFAHNQQAIMSILLDLASQLKLESNASQHLQLVLMKVAINYSIVFSKNLEGMQQKRQSAIIKFMASGKNGPGIGYDNLINILLRTNQNNIANKLRQALMQR